MRNLRQANKSLTKPEEIQRTAQATAFLSVIRETTEDGPALAALRWKDIEHLETGEARLTFTNHRGVRTRYVSPITAKEMQEMRQPSQEPDQNAFPNIPDEKGQQVKQACRHAGFPPIYDRTSIRIGRILDAICIGMKSSRAIAGIMGEPTPTKPIIDPNEINRELNRALQEIPTPPPGMNQARVKNTAPSHL